MREYLKRLRLNSNMKQHDIAERLQMSRSNYLRIENGNRQKQMSINLAQKLALIFGVDVSYILEEELKFNEQVS